MYVIKAVCTTSGTVTFHVTCQKQLMELCSLGAGNSGRSENIPSTKQLSVIDFNGRKHGIQRVVRLLYFKT